MSTEGGKPLPNELLAEIANAMPAGISSILRGSDFTVRMKPLSAFIWPRIRKSTNKRTNFWQNMALQQEKRASEWEELAKASELFSSDVETYRQGLPFGFDQAKSDEFVRRFAALNQQSKERNEQDKELSRETATFKLAWKSSKRFALELVGEKVKTGNKKMARTSALSTAGEEKDCETSGSRKRKKSIGGEEEEEATAEEMKSKKAKAN